MLHIIIRPAVIDDIDELSNMYIEMYDILVSFGMPYRLNEETIKGVLSLQLKARTCKFFVAEIEGQLVGFVVADVMRMDRKLNYDESNIIAHIKDIYVSATMSKLGIATKLLVAAEAWAKDNGATIIECNVIADNVPANNFWNKSDYNILGQIYFKKISNKE